LGEHSNKDPFNDESSNSLKSCKQAEGSVLERVNSTKNTFSDGWGYLLGYMFFPLYIWTVAFF